MEMPSNGINCSRVQNKNFLDERRSYLYKNLNNFSVFGFLDSGPMMSILLLKVLLVLVAIINENINVCFIGVSIVLILVCFNQEIIIRKYVSSYLKL